MIIVYGYYGYQHSCFIEPYYTVNIMSIITFFSVCNHGMAFPVGIKLLAIIHFWNVISFYKDNYNINCGKTENGNQKCTFNTEQMAIKWLSNETHY